MIVMLYEFLVGKEKKSWKQYVCFGLLVLLIISLRRNGIYALLIVLPLVIIRLRKNKQAAIRLAAAIVLPIMIFQFGSGYLYKKLDISVASSRAALSIPVQQVGRYVRDNLESVTPEDEAAILGIIVRGNPTIEDIAENYAPAKADALIQRINISSMKNGLKDFLAAWVRIGLRDPGTYVQAFGNMIYGWFYVNFEYDKRFYNGIHENVGMMLDGLDVPDSLQPLHKVVATFVSTIANIPCTGWLVEFSYYSWFYLVFLLLLIVRKKHDALVTLSFIWINYAIFFVGPVASTRYALPAILLFPFAFTITFKQEHAVANAAAAQEALPNQ